MINAAVQTKLDELVGSGVERGLQVAAYFDGALVLDAWAGVADASTGRPVDGESLFVAFSCGKGVLATAVHLLAERGQLDYDATVGSYWPEFANRGKEAITVRQVLTHTAGIPQLPPDTTPEDLCDWDRMCAGISLLSPLWKPGTRTGYHARTFGFVLGELVRRIDGRPVAEFIREDVCQPLGIRDLFFGIPPEAEPRVARMEDDPASAPLPPLPPDSLLPLVFPPSLPPTATFFNRLDVRRACIPSSSGIMNARSLARIYAALACGGELDGVRLLSTACIDRASALQTDEVDAVIGMPIPKGLGYMLGGELSPMGSRLTAFGHPGSGGSIGFADPEYRFAFALTKTRQVTGLPGTDAAYLVAEATRTALGIPDAPVATL